MKECKEEHDLVPYLAIQCHLAPRTGVFYNRLATEYEEVKSVSLHFKLKVNDVRPVTLDCLLYM